MQRQITELLALGGLPPEKTVTVDQLEKIESLVVSIVKPLSNVEAEALVTVFGDDGCYGIAKSVMLLIETAPEWPIESCLANVHNVWVKTLAERAASAGIGFSDGADRLASIPIAPK